MRLLIWMMIGAIGFAVGWSGSRWIVQPRSVPVGASPAAVQARQTIAPDTDIHSSAVAATTKERMDAIATLAEERASLTRDHALALAISKLEAADFPAGYDEMVALLDRTPDLRSAELAEVWMDRWLEVDTPGALQFLSSLSSLTKFPSTERLGWSLEKVRSGFGGIFRALARRQPEWTRQMLSQMEPGS